MQRNDKTAMLMQNTDDCSAAYGTFDVGLLMNIREISEIIVLCQQFSVLSISCIA